MVNPNPMLFSVVMLTYNHENFIKESIESILNQDYKDSFEFIVADDSSQDATQKIIEQIIQLGIPKHIDFKYIKNSDNIGSVANFNLAVQNVSSEIIVIADGDDVSMPNRLSQLEQMHRQFNKSLYISNAWILRENSNYQFLKESRFYTKFDLASINLNDIYTEKTPVFGASYAFHRSLLDIYGLIDSVWVTFNNIDQQLFWRAYLERGVYYSEEKLIFYKIHKGGMTLNKMNDFNQMKKVKYLLNRIGNMLYLLQYINIEDQEILLRKVKKNFENLMYLLDNNTEFLNNKCTNTDIQVGYNDDILFNGVKIRRNIQSLKTLKLDEFIFVLNKLFLKTPLNERDINLIYNACKQGLISKNEIFVLFYLLGRKWAMPLQVSISDVASLILCVLKNKMRVMKLIQEISA